MILKVQCTLKIYRVNLSNKLYRTCPGAINIEDNE